MISAENMSLIYNDHEKEVFAVREISLRIEEREFVGILGPSGSGKSSLLYLLSGLKNPSRGKVTLDGQDLQLLSDSERSKLRLKRFGFVFQQPYLLGYLTAFENVLTVSDNEQRAKELMTDLGLEQKMHRLPNELSGGERQRVCVARALINEPDVIFADEPTAALDHKNGLTVVELLNRHRKNGALVMVTHDPTMVEEADRIIKIHEGTIVENSSSELT
jgi:putative ABC transport system ATP-binding protein